MRTPHPPAPVVLLVEDEPGIRRFVRAALEAEGCAVHEAASLERGRIELANRRPDLLVLDLGLPDGDGLTLLAELRQWSGMPALVLSARSNEVDKVGALDAGADDYLAKPFGVAELLARVRALLRRSMRPPLAASRIVFGEVVVDLDQRTVTRDGQPVHLTPIEYRLLSLLIAGGGRMVTQRQLLAGAWGPNHVEHAHYLRVYMTGLRRKLERDPRLPVHILTEPGVGYRLMLEALSDARTSASAPPAG
jgi:two-component system KDP operon response regulator KdpE